MWDHLPVKLLEEQAKKRSRWRAFLDLLRDAKREIVDCDGPCSDMERQRGW